ncbi:hypothetical protein EFK50_16230 [Nocardioides marmoriginsengisoli]|uniref:DUF4386 family protein n=1 Tax=Nocardioides marmoriginsengisoli TaxID=661483 RepID=A0A3N0CIS8_9ACTN|nr:hypothetical protein [Nocardioides marmoriginsengisoli]RNL63239.1 hypothetical protein EFK50_16230 [Nocardioides marmoriginsengisoli]
MSTATSTLPRRAGSKADSAGPGRGWAYAGVAAGLSGILAIGASLSVSAVYEEENLGNAEKIVASLKDATGNLIAFHTFTMLACVTLLVFAAGIRRRLGEQTRAGSILPDVAAAGLLLASVAGLMGSALDTEFIFGVNAPKGELVPEVGALYGHWVGTVPWLWVGAGVAGVAIAVAVFKQAAAPRWIGWVGAILGGLTLVAGISPLQYMAGFTGPILVFVIALGFAFGDRDELS